MKTKFSSVDEYMASFPKKVRDRLGELRKIIKRIAPEAEEVISYNMPAFRFHGILIYYAAHKAHIGFYPANAKVIERFKPDLEGYETSKGTIRFQMERPIPVALVEKIVKYRVQKNLEKVRLKKVKKVTPLTGDTK